MQPTLPAQLLRNNVAKGLRAPPRLLRILGAYLSNELGAHKKCSPKVSEGKCRTVSGWSVRFGEHEM
jgi:hypothetical protein